MKTDDYYELNSMQQRIVRALYLLGDSPGHSAIAELTGLTLTQMRDQVKAMPDGWVLMTTAPQWGAATGDIALSFSGQRAVDGLRDLVFR